MTGRQRGLKRLRVKQDKTGVKTLRQKERGIFVFGDQGPGVGGVGQGTGPRPREALWATASKCMSDTVRYFKR